MDAYENEVPPVLWDALLRNPRTELRKWLATSDIHIELQQPKQFTMSDTSVLRCTFFVASTEVDTFLKRSGRDGIYIRRALEKEKQLYTIIWMPAVEREGALSQATQCVHTRGLVKVRNKIGVRVERAQAEPAAKELAPKEASHYAKNPFLVEGCPMDWAGVEVARHLKGAGWPDVDPEQPFIRHGLRYWRVRAPTDPPHVHLLLQHGAVVVHAGYGPVAGPKAARTQSQSGRLLEGEVAAMRENMQDLQRQLAEAKRRKADEDAERRVQQRAS